MWNVFSSRCGPWLCSLLLYGVTAWPTGAEPLSAAAAQDQEPSLFGAPVPSSQLADARGGSFQTDNQMTLTGTTSSNSATNVVTGSNAIESGAFDQMSGLPVVIQNTGANVLIQNAVIVNLQMQ